jgi:hypothetical protein
MPNAKRLDPTEIIAEVQTLSSEIDQRLSRLLELSDTLYNSVRHGHFRQERERLEADRRLLAARLDRAMQRQEPHDTLRQLQGALDGIDAQLAAHHDVVPVYTLFANSWKRFAGSMHQGMRRAASVNRIVRQVQEKHGVEHEAQARREAQPATTSPDVSIDELVELYGEETVNE